MKLNLSALIGAILILSLSNIESQEVPPVTPVKDLKKQHYTVLVDSWGGTQKVNEMLEKTSSQIKDIRNLLSYLWDINIDVEMEDIVRTKINNLKNKGFTENNGWMDNPHFNNMRAIIRVAYYARKRNPDIMQNQQEPEYITPPVNQTPQAPKPQTPQKMPRNQLTQHKVSKDKSTFSSNAFLVGGTIASLLGYMVYSYYNTSHNLDISPQEAR